MLGRRSLLTAATRTVLGLGVGLAVAGCAQRPTYSPSGGSSRVTPTAEPLPGQDALLTLVADLDARRAGSWPAPQAELIAWACGVVRDQCVTVSLPAPTPVPAAGGPAADLDKTTSDALVAALREAALTFREQALDAATARPLIWASMAAWAEVTADEVPAPDAPREPARSVLSPAPQTPEEAVAASLAAAEQAVYGLGVIGGTPGLSEDDAARLGGRTTNWLTLRDALRASTPATATPTPAAPWYQIDRPGDPTAAHAATAHLEGAALPILGRSLAYAPADVAPLLVDALVATARDVPRWGGLVERWPGLPQS